VIEKIQSPVDSGVVLDGDKKNLIAFMVVVATHFYFFWLS
jgi:hypothetical protein